MFFVRCLVCCGCRGVAIFGARWGVWVTYAFEFVLHDTLYVVVVCVYLSFMSEGAYSFGGLWLTEPAVQEPLSPNRICLREGAVQPALSYVL